MEQQPNLLVTPREKLHQTDPPVAGFDALRGESKGIGEIIPAFDPELCSHRQNHGEPHYLENIEEVLESSPAAQNSRLVDTIYHDHEG